MEILAWETGDNKYRAIPFVHSIDGSQQAVTMDVYDDISEHRLGRVVEAMETN